MEPLEEILQTVRAMRETQLVTMARQRRYIRFSMALVAVILAGYIVWVCFLFSHTN